MAVDAPTADGEPGGGSDRPAPNGAVTAAEYVSAMRRLKNWTGLSYRELEKRAAAGGDVLPRTTLTTALTHDRLPQEHLVAAFVRACGCEGDEVQTWVGTRRRIAAAEPTAEPTAPVPGEDPSADATDSGSGAAVSSPARRRSALLLASAAVLAVAVAAGVSVGDFFATDTRLPVPGPTRSEPATLPPPAQIGRTSVAPIPDPRPPTEVQMRFPTRAPRGAPKVLYVGDSIATETQGAVSYYVHRTGKAGVVPVAHPGAALCDFLSGSRRSSVPAAHKLPALVARSKPRVVALQFWGRSSKRTPCTGAASPGSEDYYRRYLAHAQSAVRQIAQAAQAAGIPRPKLVWVLQGPDKANADRIRRLNEDVYQAVADPHGDLVSDAGHDVSMAANPYETIRNGRYIWTMFLPCSDVERRHGLCTNERAYGGVAQFHAVYDNVHLCLVTTASHKCGIKSPAVIRYSTAIARTLTQALA